MADKDAAVEFTQPAFRNREAGPVAESQWRRYKVTCAYDGTPFQGWQTQAGGKTVQDVIEARLSAIFRRSITIAGSGRTDAGVHAIGQVFHVDLPPHLPWLVAPSKAKMSRHKRLSQVEETRLKTAVTSSSSAVASSVNERERLERTDRLLESNDQAEMTAPVLDADTVLQLLSRGLPPEVTVLSAELAKPGFHARNSCVGKRYVYTVADVPMRGGPKWGGPLPGCFAARWCWFPSPVNGVERCECENMECGDVNAGSTKSVGLDIQAMRRAADHLIGEHDFSSFADRHPDGLHCLIPTKILPEVIAQVSFVVNFADTRDPVKRMKSISIERDEVYRLPGFGCALGFPVVTITAECDRFLVRRGASLSLVIIQEFLLFPWLNSII
eukprot:SAG31_NODE_3350_length_4375_cov_1.732226_1_plen_385_part_00